MGNLFENFDQFFEELGLNFDFGELGETPENELARATGGLQHLNDIPPLEAGTGYPIRQQAVNDEVTPAVFLNLEMPRNGPLHEDGTPVFRSQEHMYSEIGESLNSEFGIVHLPLIVPDHPHIKTNPETNAGICYLIERGRRYTPSQGSEPRQWRENTKPYQKRPRHCYELGRKTYSVHHTGARGLLIIYPSHLLYHFWRIERQ